LRFKGLFGTSRPASYPPSRNHGRGAGGGQNIGAWAPGPPPRRGRRATLHDLVRVIEATTVHSVTSMRKATLTDPRQKDLSGGPSPKAGGLSPNGGLFRASPSIPGATLRWGGKDRLGGLIRANPGQRYTFALGPPGHRPPRRHPFDYREAVSRLTFGLDFAGFAGPFTLAVGPRSQFGRGGKTPRRMCFQGRFLSWRLYWLVEKEGQKAAVAAAITRDGRARRPRGPKGCQRLDESRNQEQEGPRPMAGCAAARRGGHGRKTRSSESAGRNGKFRAAIIQPAGP